MLSRVAEATKTNVFQKVIFKKSEFIFGTQNSEPNRLFYNTHGNTNVKQSNLKYDLITYGTADTFQKNAFI